MEFESKYKIGSSVLVLDELFGVLIIGAGEIVGIEKPRGLASRSDDKLLYKINFFGRRSFSIKTGTEIDLHEAVKNSSLLKFKEEAIYPREEEEEFKKKSISKYTKLQELMAYNFKNFMAGL